MIYEFLIANPLPMQQKTFATTLKPVETMDVSKRYLAVVDNEGANDSWVVAYWEIFDSTFGYWTSEANEIKISDYCGGRHRAEKETYYPINIKGWALELPEL